MYYIIIIQDKIFSGSLPSKKGGLAAMKASVASLSSSIIFADVAMVSMILHALEENKVS